MWDWISVSSKMSDQYRVLLEIANLVNSKGAFGNGLCIASDPISPGRRKLNVFYWNLWEILAYLLFLIEIIKSDHEKTTADALHEPMFPQRAK